MCGIIGIISKKEFSTKELIGKLKRLEYRGYDSAGIATINKGKITVQKSVGKIKELEKKVKNENTKIGIAHTRWGTTGPVTEYNTHPHLDCTNTIAVVHNGVIENYLRIRETLAGKGHKFKSETDTEVIPHMIEEYKLLGWEKAVEKAGKSLKGRNTFIAVTDGEDIGIYKNGSPIVIGIGKHRFYIASDTLPFLDNTRKAVFIEDGQLAFVGNDVKLLHGKPKIIEIDWNFEMAKKEGHPHFMIKEIMEQSATIENAATQSEEKIKKIASIINKSFGSFFIACGTAGYAALAASYFFSDIAKKHINSCIGSEFPLQKHFLTDKSLVIAISQSGETADTLEAVEAAKEKGSIVIGVVNVPGSTLVRQADYHFLTNAGPEIAVCSTKALTSQLSLTLLLAYAVTNKIEEGKKLLKTTAEEAGKMLNKDYLKKIESLAEKIKDRDHIYVIGKGFNYPIALEAALKIKEVSYIHAEGFASGELKHGVIALVEQGTPCIAIVANDGVKDDVITGATEMSMRGGYIIGISPENHDVFDEWIPVPDVGKASPIINTIPCQLLAYYLAVKRGHDPDYPRNLAKCVTVK